MKRMIGFLSLVVFLLFAACDEAGVSVSPDDPGDLDAISSQQVAGKTAGNGQFEVWLVDQSNTTGLGYGGKIYVYNGPDLMGSAAAKADPIATVDLAGATADLCLSSTGANPVRPHMLHFNASYSHAVLAFVVSGHVVIFDAATGTPVSCIRTSPGAGGSRQAHAAFPSADETYILVANQNGKLLERIDTDYASNSFVLNAAATLDLAGCTTPNGQLCEHPVLRPDNAPICPILDASSRLGFVTLRGGGLFVVDPTQEPMQIIGEYDMNTVAGNGCGGAQAGNRMFINSGGGTASNLSGFDVYRFPVTGYDVLNPENTPAPTTIFSDPSADRDSHGMVVTKGGRYLWVMDRAANVAEVFDVRTDAHVNTVHLAGVSSDDPAPDLADLAPAGNRIFVSLRGPSPLSGDPHVATGSTPGLGILRVENGGQGGFLSAVVPISNKDANGQEFADAHGIRVRHRP